MKRVSSLMLSLVFVSWLSAQNTEHTEKYKPRFGFSVGLNQSALYNSNAINELKIENALGFRLGVFAEFPIAERWAILPKSELSFNYGRVIQNNDLLRVDPYNLNFMLHAKNKFNGYTGKVLPYMVFGPNLRMPLNQNFEGAILDTKAALNFDFGFGVEIEAKHFYFSPELRFSGGLTDIRKNPSGKTLRGSNAALILNFSGK